MASAAALAALRKSPQSWHEYRDSHVGRIDLTVAAIGGLDLRARDFTACDFSGSELEGANLDDCIFHDASLEEATLVNCSLVRCDFRAVSAVGASFVSSVARKSTFNNVDLTSADLSRLRVTSCRIVEGRFESTNLSTTNILNTTFERCFISACRAEGLVMASCEFDSSRVIDTSWPSARLVGTRFEKCSISGLNLEKSTMRSCSLLRCDVVRLNLNDAQAADSDFTGSEIRSVNLRYLNLGDAVMLGTAVSSCSWPQQSPRLGIFGGYKRSEYLLSQPVQDIRGIAPTLRREIADAQYLDELHSRDRTWYRAVGFRLWGATTAYGQSIARLTASALVLIVLLSLWLLGTELGEVRRGVVQLAGNATKSFQVIGSSFLGLAGPSLASPSTMQHAIIVLARIGGFLILGLWVAVAATKLGRLSSE